MKLLNLLPVLLVACCGIEPQDKEPAPIKRETAHTLTLFMAPYENLFNEPQFKHEIKEEMYQDPFYLSKKIIANNFVAETDPQGVKVLYGGFDDTIDVNRQVRFPLMGSGQENPEEFTLIITRKLRPVVLHGNTVEYFIRDTKYDIAYYSLVRRFDPQQQLYYWDITKKETPADQKIPVSAVIIFADPNNIFVPLKPVVAVPGPNIVLPTVYATKLLAKDYNAASFIKISQYFDPVDEVTKIVPPKRYGQKIRNIGT